MRSVSVPFLTKWCWNSVCLPCWSDDHGTLFELHGKTNGKSAQHPWWHQSLLVEHLEYNKSSKLLTDKRLPCGWRGRGGRGRGFIKSNLYLERGTKMLSHFCKRDPFCGSGHIYPPPPVYTHPLPPKSMLNLRLASLSFSTHNIDSGVRVGDWRHYV